MEAGGPLRPQNRLHAVQDALHGLRPLVSAQRAGVQVAEVHAGQKPFIQRTQLQHLVQVPQLVDFPHGLRAQGDMSEPGGVAGGDDLPQGVQRGVQRLPPCALHQRPGVDDHPAGSHPVRHQARAGDIAGGLLQRLPVRVGQVDEVGGMEGQGNALPLRGKPHPPGGVLPHVDALAALVFVAVQAELPQPAGRVRRGLIGEIFRVSRRAEQGAHSAPPLPDSSRKGHSAA